MKDLRDFIKLLRDKGELVTIDTPVDPVLEITEIADRVSKAQGPALLFTQPRGHSVPILINQFGSDKRVCLALRARSYDELAGRVEHLVSLDMPDTLGRSSRLWQGSKTWPRCSPGWWAAGLVRRSY